MAIGDHRALLQQVMDLEEKNQRLHSKLTKALKRKAEWKLRAERASVMGKKTLMAVRPKREIVARGGHYFAVYLVELEAETDAGALAEALRYVHEQDGSARIHRIVDHGVGRWEAEIEVYLTPEPRRG